MNQLRFVSYGGGVQSTALLVLAAQRRIDFPIFVMANVGDDSDCPFHRPVVWDAMAREEPELFERAADLEDTLNRRRETLGKDPVYLTRFNAPLRTIVVRGQDTLWQDEPVDVGCDSGWCMT